MSLCELLYSFCKTYLSSLGGIWLVIEIYNGLMPQKFVCSFKCLILFTLIVAGILFLLDGYLFSGFLKQKIVLTSNAFGTKIIIQFGDIFKKDGWKAIAVNEFFDSIVDERHVSSKSLHGAVLKKYWSNNIEDWNQQIGKSLFGSDFVENVARNSGKSKKYKIGATAIAEKDNEKFLFVALSKTDISNLQSSSGLFELYQSLTGLLTKSREVCSGQPLNIPLFGSGLSRSGIKTNVILYIMLAAIFKESSQNEITEEIRIILPKNRKKEIFLNNILRDWR